MTPGPVAARSAVVALLLASAAQARELYRQEDGLTVEGRGFFKSFLTVVAPSPGLADSLAAMGALLDETRPLLPPDQAALLPVVTSLPPSAAVGFSSVRLGTTVSWRDWLELNAAWQLSATLASSASFTQGASVSGFVGTGLSGPAKRRLWDFEPVLASAGSWRLEHNLDQLSVKVHTRRADVIVGRQVLSWGAGRLWNPTDLLSPFAPTVVDKEVRRGIDAVRVSVPFGETTQLDVLWLPQRLAAEMGGALRLVTNVKDTDVSVSAAKYVRDVVLGADFSGDLGPLGVHGEAAYTLSLEGLWEGGRTVQVGEHFLRAVAGVDWRPADEWVLMAEYHFNGSGSPLASHYVERLSTPRAARGEVFGAGRHYLGLVAAWRPDELVSVSGLVLANVTDPSVLLVPSVEWWFEQTVILRAGASLPLGRWPDASGLRALTPADVLGQTDAWRAESRSLGVTSEYGMGSFGVFVQVAVYVP